jgi:hypothetical protein
MSTERKLEPDISHILDILADVINAIHDLLNLNTIKWHSDSTLQSQNIPWQKTHKIWLL